MDKKIAFTTTCSNGYAIFLDHLIKSILKFNHDFNIDFYIFCDARLNEHNRIHLKSLYKNFVFKDIDFSVYEQNYKGSIKYYSMECFRLTGYDRVIYFGADMLCLKSLKELLDIAQTDIDIAMPKEKRRGGFLPFNNGAMIIGNKYLNEDTFNKLMRYNSVDLPGQLTDQKLYNYYFSGQIQEISQKFNTLISELDFITYNEILLLHYIYKPTTELGRRHIREQEIKEWEQYDNKDGRYKDIVG